MDATLTLLNGRRIAPYGAGLYGTEFFVDLNAIPVQAIERIEVLKVGASAICGAEAVAGVININQRDAIDGIHVDAGYLATTQGDGAERNIGVSGGFNRERSRGSFALSYLDIDAIYLWSCARSTSRSSRRRTRRRSD